MNEEYITDFMGNWVPNPDYIPPSGTWGSIVPPQDTTSNPPSDVVTQPPATQPEVTPTVTPPADTTNQPPANTTNTMPLNGQDELIIDPITGLPINQTPGMDPVNPGGQPTVINPVDTNPVDNNPVTNPPSDPVTNPGNTPSGTAGAGGNTGVPTGSNSNPFVNTGGGGGWSALTGQGGLNVPQASVSGVGGNYNQVQNSNQGGIFNTTGATAGEQNMTQGQSGSQSSTGQQTSTVDTNQTTGAVDTLGFGQLLKDAATGAQSTDAARTGFLTDTMNTGGSAMQSQLDQGIRNALSGPGMTGAGESARARAAGYAGAEVGRNNLNQRLAASEQLSGPTALSNLSTAANPYVGSTTSGTQQSLTDSLQNVASNSSGWQKLLSQTAEAQSGSTAAQSSQAGAGTIPEGQPVKTGGCVLCTAGIELGIFNHRRALRRVIQHKLHTDWKHFRLAARGYFAIFTPFAHWLLTHPRIAKLLLPLAKGVVYEELRVSGRKLPLRVGAWITHWAGHWACSAIGLLPVRGHVTDPVILSIAKREQIIFNVRN